MNKVKLIRAIGIRSRANVMNKTHKAIGFVEDKMHNLLDNAKCKSYVLCTTNLIYLKAVTKKKKKL